MDRQIRFFGQHVHVIAWQIADFLHPLSKPVEIPQVWTKPSVKFLGLNRLVCCNRCTIEHPLAAVTFFHRP
jgi:hypothetical protein